jgi:hypothetical protein
MNLHPIYALVIASLMVLAVALALVADRALAAEPQMPEDFQGTWCGEGKFPGESSYYSGRCPKHEPDPTGVTTAAATRAILITGLSA